jgi:type I restriction enzyme S subunit
MSKVEKIKVGDHIRIIPGFPFNSQLFNIDGEGLPLVRIRDLLQSKIETFYKGEFSDDFIISENDILIGMDGDFHIVKWKNKKKALLNQRIMKVAQKEGALIDIGYFYYFLFPFLKETWDKTTATTVKHLSTYDISEAYEEFPSLSEQRHIALIFSTADAVLEKTQTAITKYKAIKQGMLHDLFTRGIDISTDKLRPKYENVPELYKDSKLGLMPREWEEKQLFEIVDRLSPVTYGIVQPGKFDPNGILLIRGQDYISGWAKEPEFFRVSENLHKQFIRSKTVKGDILMCIVGATYGAVSVVPDWIEEANITQTTARIRCDKNSFSPLFLEYYLKSEFGKFFINKYVKGSAQPGLNLGDVDKFIVRYPNELKEQELIGERMRSIDKKIISEQTYLHKLQMLKAGLMGDLLSGKKRVNADTAVNEDINATSNNVII